MKQTAVRNSAKVKKFSKTEDDTDLELDARLMNKATINYRLLKQDR